MSLTQSDINACVLAAQGNVFELDKCGSERIAALVSANSNAIGSPVEFIYFPLLSLCAHFMGPTAKVKVTEDWKEPVIIWTVVLADKGQKKSPALNRLIVPIKTLEEEMISNFADESVRAEEESEEKEEKEEKIAPQIFIEHFSMEQLHYTLKRNNGRVVGLYDEVSLLYEQLDKYKNGSGDRKTFLSLINGSQWRRNFRNSQSVLDNPCFNLAGFVQPDVIINMLNGNDYDGFCDRQLFVCPAEKYADFDEIIAPPLDTPNLCDLFKLIDEAHKEFGDLYNLSEEAHKTFVNYHDNHNAINRSLPRSERDRKSILAKSVGQSLRVAAVLFALDQAVEMYDTLPATPDRRWDFNISNSCMEQAIRVMDFCIEQKMALKKGETQVQALSNEGTDDLGEREVFAGTGVSADDVGRLRRMIELKSPISVADISQRKIQRKVERKCRAAEAEELMAIAEKLNLGKVENIDYQAGSQTRYKKVFRKRKREEISDEDSELLKKLKIDVKFFEE